MNLFFPMGWTFDLVVLGYQHPAAIGGQTGSGTAPEIDPETGADGRGNLDPLGGEIGFLDMHPLNQHAGSEVVLELRLDEGGQVVITAQSPVGRIDREVLGGILYLSLTGRIGISAVSGKPEPNPAAGRLVMVFVVAPFPVLPARPAHAGFGEVPLFRLGDNLRGVDGKQHVEMEPVIDPDLRLLFSRWLDNHGIARPDHMSRGEESRIDRNRLRLILRFCFLLNLGRGFWILVGLGRVAEMLLQSIQQRLGIVLELKSALEVQGDLGTLMFERPRFEPEEAARPGNGDVEWLALTIIGTPGTGTDLQPLRNHETGEDADPEQGDRGGCVTGVSQRRLLLAVVGAPVIALADLGEIVLDDFPGHADAVVGNANEFLFRLGIAAPGQSNLELFAPS